MKFLSTTVLLSFILLFPSSSRAGEMEDGLLTLWESLWHQVGTPTLLNRWEGKVSYRYFGVNLELHRKHFEKILAQTSSHTGIIFEDISNQSDAKEKARFHVEVVANNGDIPERLGCYVQHLKAPNFKLQEVELRMRDRDAYHCNLHEMMHAMGIVGHPSGDTVLTYFNQRADKFLPLDEFLLQAWYSAALLPGMTPFQTIDALSLAWVERFASSRLDARKVRQEFLEKIVGDSQRFADGTGEVPRILIRSGMLGPGSVAKAKIDMKWMLGISYQYGHIVQKDVVLAESWFERAALEGSSPAMFFLGILNEQRAGTSQQANERAYYWYAVGDAYKHPACTAARSRLLSKLSPEIIAKLDAEAAMFKLSN